MTAGTTIEALYFDGHSARARRVQLAVDAAELVASFATDDPPAEDLPAAQRWPMSAVHWPERTRHGRRVIQLQGGGQFDVADSAAFDAWRAAHGPRESWVVRAQQHWRATLTALVLLGAVVAAGYRWGVPWAADALVAVVPPQVDRAVGESAYQNLRARWLEPSALPPARQREVRDLCTQALQAGWPGATQRPWALHFARGGSALGANAFALPDGTIVITDEMVNLLAGHDDTLVGVFAHEYGHVHLRHGMRALARFTLISTATSVALGDFSAVLAGLPALLAQLGYSRDAEREADEVAARVLVASGRRPEVMSVLFERLTTQPRGDSPGSGGRLPIALASHPHDDERVRFFREYDPLRR